MPAPANATARSAETQMERIAIAACRLPFAASQPKGAANQPRPIRPEMSIYPGAAGIPAQPGRQPSYQTDVEIL